MYHNSDLKEPPHHERFRRNLLDLYSVVQKLFQERHEGNEKTAKGHGENKTIINPSLFTVIDAIIESYDSIELINIFINGSYRYWAMIIERDESFFHVIDDDNSAISRDRSGKYDMFSELPDEASEIFSYMFRQNKKSIISEDDKDAIWDYFDSFVKISIKYIHEQREPIIRDLGNGNGPEKLYRKNIFSEVRINKYANIWDIKLDW